MAAMIEGIKKYLLGFPGAMLTLIVAMAVCSSVTLALLLAQHYLHLPFSFSFSLGVGGGIAISVSNFLGYPKAAPRISNNLQKNLRYLLDQFGAFVVLCLIGFLITHLFKVSWHEQSRYLPVAIGGFCGLICSDAVYYGLWRLRPGGAES